MKVQELMSHQAFTCQSGETLNHAAQLMWEHDCGCVPIVDAAGKVVGIVTDRDIAMAAYTKGKPLSAIRIDDVMSRSIQQVGPNDPLADAETAMQMHRVRRLPVVDHKARVIGVISLSDIARAARQQRRSRRPEVTTDELALTLARICEPRALLG